MTDTYGLTAFNANGTLILDGSSNSYQSLVVKSTGSISNAGASGTQITIGAGHILFATKTSGTGAIGCQSGGTTPRLFGTNIGWITVGADSTTYTGSEDYGLKVFNQSGAQVYDSRGKTTGLSITNVFPPGALSGTRSGWTSAAGISSGDTMTSTTSSYVSMSTGVCTNLSDIVFNGAYWDSNGIKYVSFVDLAIPDGNLNMGFDNWSPIMIAQSLS